MVYSLRVYVKIFHCFIYAGETETAILLGLLKCGFVVLNIAECCLTEILLIIPLLMVGLLDIKWNWNAMLCLYKAKLVKQMRFIK